MSLKDNFLNEMERRGWAGSREAGFLKRGAVTLMFSFNSFRANLELITVGSSQRGKGEARNALCDITRAADAAGLTLTLTVMPMGTLTDVERLARLYESAGFSRRGRTTEGPLMVRAARQAEISPETPNGGIDENAEPLL